MIRFVAGTLLLIWWAVPAVACSCIRTGSACAWFGGIVFVGRVLVDSGEDWGERPAKVRVEEVLSGLSRDLREVEVNTHFGTSCYSRLKKDERYIIYADRSEKYPNVLVAGGCSYLFNVKGNEVLLDALRNAATNGPPRLIGRVRSSSIANRYSDGDPVVQARVVAKTEGREYEATSDAMGWFEILGVAPGAYRVESSLPGYVFDDEDRDKLVQVPQNGCEVKHLRMTAAGRISGTVRYRNGRPVKDVTVDVFEIEAPNSGEGEEAASSPFASAATDDHGSYSIHPLPPGKYIVGVNGDADEDRDPHPPSFYPDGATRENAVRVALAAAAHHEGIDLVLARPRLPGTLKVRLIYPDGRPVAGAHAKAVDRRGAERYSSNEKTDVHGEIELSLFQGEEYEVEAFKYHARTQKTANQHAMNEYRGTAGPVRLDRSVVHVQIVMHLRIE